MTDKSEEKQASQSVSGDDQVKAPPTGTKKIVQDTGKAKDAPKRGKRHNLPHLSK